MTVSSSFRPSFQSGNKEMPEFTAFPKAPNSLTSGSNSEPSLVAFLVFKYTKNNFQQVLWMVLKIQLPRTHGQDRGISKNLSERALKSKASDNYQGKSQIDCHNFI